MQRAVYWEHPFEHFEEALHLHICAIIQPRVCFRAAAEVTFNRASGRQSHCLRNQGTIVKCCMLYTRQDDDKGTLKKARTFQSSNVCMSFGSGRPSRANLRLINTVGCSTFAAVDTHTLYDFGIVSGRRSQEYMICPQLKNTSKGMIKKETAQEHVP